MVLLRIAIGWHVCYEGLTKLNPHFYELSNPRTAASKEWSAEGYLRNASGPFRDYFRKLVPDLEGFDALNADKVTARWKTTLDRFATHYAFTPDQRQKADKLLTDLTAKLQDYLGSDETKKKIESYRKQREEWQRIPPANSPDPLVRQTRLKSSTDLDGVRRDLTGRIDSWTHDLETGLLSLLTDEQRALSVPTIPWQERTELEKANEITKWGLAICGGCMIAGLFSRLASLGTACFLALFYFSSVPWPGYPMSPITEGTYFIVNKNLIELIACLMLATSPSGVWGGFDALIRGLITRPLFGVGAREVRDRYGFGTE